jgi:type VI secretion system protein ImpG
MDPRLLKYYNRELQYIREMGGEFAGEYPKIAARLGLDGFECADPYVERLLEGFSFLAARVQLKLDAEFPRFTQHLLEMVYPHSLSPTPSMVIAQYQPNTEEAGLAEGFTVPRNLAMRSLLGKGEQTPCEYRSAHAVQLWPLEISGAEYLNNVSAVVDVKGPARKIMKAGLRLRLRATAGLSFDKLRLESLPVYLRGHDELPMHLYEQILANGIGMVVRSVDDPQGTQTFLDRSHLRRYGFAEDQSLLKIDSRSFTGYRLLHEYFAFPERFMFVDFAGIGPAVRRCTGGELEIIVLFDRLDARLDTAVTAQHLALFCTPAINLFPMRADHIHLSDQRPEYHVLPDRTRPMDFEVYSITGVTGIGSSADQEQPFLPFYSVSDMAHSDQRAYFTIRREPRLLSAKQRSYGPRSSYIGSEAYISLVDANEAPYKSDLRQLAVNTLCTNRDLPLHMTVGKGNTDFNIEAGGPVSKVRVLAGPSKPRPSSAYTDGDTTWRLISHLSLNYMSLMDVDERHGAAGLRDLLMLYSDVGEAHIKKQIDGVKSVHAQPVTRRLPFEGPITFGRGQSITVTLDENAFQGTGVFLLGAVLDEFFARYVSINSFTETVIKTTERGEIMRWPVRTGRRQTL